MRLRGLRKATQLVSDSAHSNFALPCVKAGTLYINTTLALPPNTCIMWCYLILFCFISIDHTMTFRDEHLWTFQEDTWGFSKLKELPEIAICLLFLISEKNPVRSSFHLTLQATNIMIHTLPNPDWDGRALTLGQTGWLNIWALMNYLIRRPREKVQLPCRHIL